jgi:methyltransferase (TIGR00027 family)
MISDVSDTALWVATYRAEESERPDALFRDPLAHLLMGERGEKIAASMSGSQYVKWSVVIRTHIIDAFIREQIAGGVDMVINLGAGLDTRPYRLELPQSLRWIEVDYPHMIQFKEECLAGETPKCKLERIGLDLADEASRSKLFSRLGSESKKALILTEGVLIYLTVDQVASLAKDLRQQRSFRYWIADYHSPRVFQYMKSRKRQKELQNAPFQFNPENWFTFFSDHRWNARDTRYLAEESDKLGRAIPMPGWVKFLRLFFRPKGENASRKFSAYVLLEAIKD